MRQAIGVIVAVLLLVSCQTTSTTTSTDPLAGAWELVSGRMIDAQGKTTEYSDIRCVKVLADGRFSFLMTHGGVFNLAAAGKYAISGNTYTETVTESSGRPAPGTYTFTWRVEGDRWYHKGGTNGVVFDEVWRRVR